MSDEENEIPFDDIGGENQDDSSNLSPATLDEEAQAAMFANLVEEESNAGIESDDDIQDLEVILDIPVTLSVEIGHTEISIRKLLSLGQGSVVELDRLAGEPLDIKVNGMLIAHGEVVVINDKFGIRLTDIISTAERIQKLK